MTPYEARLAIYRAIERSLSATDANGQPFFAPKPCWQIMCAPEDFNAVSEAADDASTMARHSPGGTIPDAGWTLLLLPNPAFPVGVIVATPCDLPPVVKGAESPWS